MKSFKALVPHFDLIFCRGRGTFEKTAFRIINLLAQLINQLTQVNNNLGSFVYADYLHWDLLKLPHLG